MHVEVDPAAADVIACREVAAHEVVRAQREVTEETLDEECTTWSPREHVA